MMAREEGRPASDYGFPHEAGPGVIVKKTRQRLSQGDAAPKWNIELGLFEDAQCLRYCNNVHPVHQLRA